ncbi:MAG: hypothetical protein RLZZ546_1086 [Bacteroidota bacterium]|jgi:hypothetical protein
MLSLMGIIKTNLFMNLVRKYKISKAINVTLTGAEGKAIALIESRLSNLTPYNLSNQFVSIIYYMSIDGDYVIQNEPTMGGTYVRSFGFWDVLQEEYGIRDEDIQWVILYILKRKYPDMNIKSLISSYVLKHETIEDMYKRDELNKKI